jgi:hypothetical protein
MIVWYRGAYKNVAIIIIFFNMMLIHMFFNVEYAHMDMCYLCKMLSSIKM